jgi:hypothetical protein
MIPCHELRTGNIILVNNRLRKVSTITNSHSLADHSSVGVESITNGEPDNYPVENIDPVVLTDLILQQCSFVYHKYFKFWQLIRGIAERRSEMDIDRDYNIIDFMRKPVVKKVTSLHHLQNIYYMLNGKELVFDEDVIQGAEPKSRAFSES